MKSSSDQESNQETGEPGMVPDSRRSSGPGTERSSSQPLRTTPFPPADRSTASTGKAPEEQLQLTGRPYRGKGVTVFEAVGGMETFRRLVDAFYAGVSVDPILRPMYPDDLEPPKRRLALFIAQFFGGPQVYSAERGHPRLRARHLRFRIDQAARDAWIRRMTAALDTLDLPAAARAEFLRYFEDAATFLINQDER